MTHRSNSDETTCQDAKTAALRAVAAEPAPGAAFVQLESRGVILICGRDERAIEAGKLLKDHLDVTVLIAPPAAVASQPANEFPVAKGKIRTAAGHLGAFGLTVDDFALALPSSRGLMEFEPAPNNARSNCDIVLEPYGAQEGGRVKLLRTIRLDATDLSVFDTQHLIRRCGQQQIHRPLKPRNPVTGLPIRQVEGVN